MTTEDMEESQSVVEDGGVGGPGAPTPLSALEVCLIDRFIDSYHLTILSNRVSQASLREIFN